MGGYARVSGRVSRSRRVKMSARMSGRMCSQVVLRMSGRDDSECECKCMLCVILGQNIFNLPLTLPLVLTSTVQQRKGVNARGLSD